MQDRIPIIIIVVSGTLLFVLLVVIIIVSMLFYQQAKNKHNFQLQDMENTYQQEILKAALEVKENTLKHISQEIHDNIGQVLSLAKLNVNQLIKHQKENGNSRLDDLKGLIQKAIDDLRMMSRNLNSGYIEQVSLAELVRHEADKLRQLGMFEVSVDVTQETCVLDQRVNVMLYRMLQEMISNVLKHARASHVAMSLQFEGAYLVLCITDNGQGFDVEKQENRGTGLINLHQRAQLIGAQLTIESERDKGTCITLRYLPSENEHPNTFENEKA